MPAACEAEILNGLHTAEEIQHPKAIPSVSYPTRSLECFSHIVRSVVGSNESSAPAQSIPQQTRLPLEILIVGAGLGGLATAIALKRRGHSVTVLEQAHELGEVGAGIQIPSNSNRLLNRWGVGALLEGKAVEPRGMTFRRWQNGSKIAHTKLVPEFRENFGASYHVVHRAHFHDALHRRALQLGVEVTVDCQVVKYDLETPSVELANGTLMSADLIIGADGVKSMARKYILNGNDQPPKAAGFAVYRSTVDVEKIQTDPDISWITEHPALNIWIGEGRHVMTYTMAGGKSFNMVLSHIDKSHPSMWKKENAVEDMRKEFTGWDPQLTKIINLVDKTMKWPLVSGSTLKSWIAPTSKVLILGDAAHAMVPYMSQGAAMAVEDGAALAVALNKIETKSSVAFALRVFEKERMERTRQMQEASLTNGILWHFPDGPQQQIRDDRTRAEVEGRHFIASANQWSDPVTQWWAYGYDAEAAMECAWKAAVSELISKVC